jgi:hypothetical protein
MSKRETALLARLDELQHAVHAQLERAVEVAAAHAGGAPELQPISSGRGPAWRSTLILTAAAVAQARVETAPHLPPASEGASTFPSPDACRRDDHAGGSAGASTQALLPPIPSPPHSTATPLLLVPTPHDTASQPLVAPTAGEAPPPPRVARQLAWTTGAVEAAAMSVPPSEQHAREPPRPLHGRQGAAQTFAAPPRRSPAAAPAPPLAAYGEPSEVNDGGMGAPYGSGSADDAMSQSWLAPDTTATSSSSSAGEPPGVWTTPPAPAAGPRRPPHAPFKHALRDEPRHDEPVAVALAPAGGIQLQRPQGPSGRAVYVAHTPGTVTDSVEAVLRAALPPPTEVSIDSFTFPDAPPASALPAVRNHGLPRAVPAAATRARSRSKPPPPTVTAGLAALPLIAAPPPARAVGDDRAREDDGAKPRQPRAKRLRLADPDAANDLHDDSLPPPARETRRPRTASQPRRNAARASRRAASVVLESDALQDEDDADDVADGQDEWASPEAAAGRDPSHEVARGATGRALQSAVDAAVSRHAHHGAPGGAASRPFALPPPPPPQPITLEDRMRAWRGGAARWMPPVEPTPPLAACQPPGGDSGPAEVESAAALAAPLPPPVAPHASRASGMGAGASLAAPHTTRTVAEKAAVQAPPPPASQPSTGSQALLDWLAEADVEAAVPRAATPHRTRGGGGGGGSAGEAESASQRPLGGSQEASGGAHRAAAVKGGRLVALLMGEEDGDSAASHSWICCTPTQHANPPVHRILPRSHFPQRLRRLTPPRHPPVTPLILRARPAPRGTPQEDDDSATSTARGRTGDAQDVVGNKRRAPWQ